jgi:XRE family transcriptional regulator, fatty acid utilization regulator
VSGFHAQSSTFAIGLGCDIEYARRLVYADGLDLADPRAVVPIGLTCRVCPRVDCRQRAEPRRAEQGAEPHPIAP